MSNRGRAKRDVEFLHPGANAPGVNSKIKKIQKNVKKFWIFLWHTYTNVCCARKISSRNHIGGRCGKKIDALKMLLTKAFWSSDFVFLARLPRMWFHDENFHAQETLMKVCHKKYPEFFEIFFYFFDFTVHTRSICSWV